MGASGYFAFENDDAWDWFAELNDADDCAIFLTHTFDAVLESDGEYLDVGEGSNVIAAAEIVTALLGRATALPDEVIQWVEQRSSSHTVIDSVIVRKAIDAVNQVANEGSELRELWEDSAWYSDWKAIVDDLLRRLELEVE